jgi:hypothetical protein
MNQIRKILILFLFIVNIIPVIKQNKLIIENAISIYGQDLDNELPEVKICSDTKTYFVSYSNCVYVFEREVITSVCSTGAISDDQAEKYTITDNDCMAAGGGGGGSGGGGSGGGGSVGGGATGGCTGGAHWDKNCGICVGGNTGLTDCVQDCFGVWGGTAHRDNCANCVGGTTGKPECKVDCFGVWGGAAFNDPKCGCVGGTSNEYPCSIPLKIDCTSKATTNSNNSTALYNYNNSKWQSNINAAFTEVTTYARSTENGFVLTNTNGTYDVDTKFTNATDHSGSFDFSTNMVATLHEHCLYTTPGGTTDTDGNTPSPGDLQGLLESRHDGATNLSDSYVICADKNTYDLHIDDPAAAATFFGNITGMVNTDGSFNPNSSIGRDFLGIRDNLYGQLYSQGGQRDRNIAGSLAMAYVLEKYNAGVTILKRNADGTFKQLSVEEIVSNGTKYYRPSICN